MLSVHGAVGMRDGCRLQLRGAHNRRVPYAGRAILVYASIGIFAVDTGPCIRIHWMKLSRLHLLRSQLVTVNTCRRGAILADGHRRQVLVTIRKLPDILRCVQVAFIVVEGGVGTVIILRDLRAPPSDRIRVAVPVRALSLERMLCTSVRRGCSEVGMVPAGRPIFERCARSISPMLIHVQTRRICRPSSARRRVRPGVRSVMVFARHLWRRR